MLPPRLSRQIPVSKGLHHHGQAPEAAGYTIEELSILARSAVAAQRCIAFQTIGRIFYRLGKGEWGNSDEDTEKMRAPLTGLALADVLIA
ncbi:RNA polymerase II-associated protein rba50 like [Verticillium longisporum]|nr:RNA polymerase II-associated protein rba50 like [Verticillium longisporum]